MKNIHQFEDILPIENGDFAVNHVFFREGNKKNTPPQKKPPRILPWKSEAGFLYRHWVRLRRASEFSMDERPFGRGPTTRSLTDLYSNHD